MCHDISFSANTVEFINDLLPGIVWDKQISIDFMVTDHVLSMTNPNAIAIYKKDGVLRGSEFSWRVIFDYMKTAELIKEKRPRYANTRVENIFDKRLPWYSIRQQRCLIVINGIYEHRKVKGFKNKIPYFVKLACSSHMLLPAFYNFSPIGDPETGEVLGTYSLLTRDANEIMRHIHNDGDNKFRMPLFMQPNQAVRWLDDLTDEQIQAFVKYEIPSEDLDATPVFTIRGQQQRQDGKLKNQFHEWPNLPPLGIDEIVTQNSLF